MSLTSKIYVGDVAIGGDSPVVVQSMLNAKADDLEANLAQIEQLAEAGCEIVRMAIPHRDNLDIFERVVRSSPLPVVADVHFDHVIAIEAAKRGASKLRINPGNIGSFDRTLAVIDAAKECDIPIRIGVNAGSLDKKYVDNANMSLPEKLAASVCEYVQMFESVGFYDIVASAKANNVMATVDTYRLLHSQIPHIPLHIGITEAGTKIQGLIKSASGLGILLAEGIGDTLRISLTDDPVVEVKAAWQLLGALDIRRRVPELVSCPTCGRCQVDLISIAKLVEERIAGIEAPIKVAVMGCVVNGPGEAADADVGIASGDGCAVVFSHGKIISKVDESQIVDALMHQIESIREKD